MRKRVVNLIKTKRLSRTMIKLDYTIMIILILLFVIFTIINGIHINIMDYKAFEEGNTYYVPKTLFDLNILGTICTLWAAQMGVSSAAYYFMNKSDHKIELIPKTLEEIPPEYKEKIEPNQVIGNIINMN